MSVSKKSGKRLRTPRLPSKIFEYLPSSVREQIAAVKRATKLEGKPLSEILWEKNTSKADEALNTGFIQGIKSGSLDPTDYGKYTVQDAVYCYHATEYLSTAKSKAEDMNDEVMTSFLDARITSFTEYTKSMFEDWHINDPKGITLGRAALAYTVFERSIAETKPPFYLLIAMLPCEQLWGWLAKQIESGISDTNVYSFWIEENLTDGIGSFAEFIDTYAEQYNVDQTEAEQIYSTGMQCEVNFFSSSTE